MAALRPELERIAGRDFVLDDHVQDASFGADLSIQRSDSGSSNQTDTVFAVRFSNFGDLFTTWSCCQVEELPAEAVMRLVASVVAAGFRSIPEPALVEAYAGHHPGFAGSTWSDRFFDYL